MSAPSGRTPVRLRAVYLATLAGAAAVAVAATLVATVLPIAHQDPVQFVVPGSSGSGCGVSPAVVPSVNGELSFAWSSSQGPAGSMSLYLEPVAPGSVAERLYLNNSSGGTGGLEVWDGNAYFFEFCGTLPNASASVRAVYEYRAPWI